VGVLEKEMDVENVINIKEFNGLESVVEKRLVRASKIKQKLAVAGLNMSQYTGEDVDCIDDRILVSQMIGFTQQLQLDLLAGEWYVSTWNTGRLSSPS